jgi:hypothetical protein
MGLLVTTACGSSAPPAGEERGPCYGNGTCNAGLSCYSSICVRTGGGGTGGGGGGGTGGGGGGSAAPVVQNADFETPAVAMGSWAYLTDLSGVVWSGPAGAGVANGIGAWGKTGHSGSQYAFVQNTASMKQTISGFVPGRTYRITFWMVSRNGNAGGDVNNPIEVALSGVGSVFGPTGPGFGTEWRSNVTLPFTATSSSHELTFIGTNASGDKTSLIDDVSIE